MTKRELMARLQNGDTIVIARERCFFTSDLATAPRKMVEALQDADKIVFSHKHNNFSKAYKLA